MIIETTLDTEYFLNTVNTLTFKDKDEEEAKDILVSSSGSVKQILKEVYNRWAEHYLIIDPEIDKIICVITLDIYNNLHYFVTKDLTIKNSIKFVKTIKRLVDETVKYRHVVFVMTKSWYTEAIKFNKLIGFKLLEENKEFHYTKWYYSKRKGY